MYGVPERICGKGTSERQWPGAGLGEARGGEGGDIDEGSERGGGGGGGGGVRDRRGVRTCVGCRVLPRQEQSGRRTRAQVRDVLWVPH